MVDNRNRGIFAEWLVGRALGVIEASDVRTEWDAVDLRFGDLRLEVKASGLSQAWNPLVLSSSVYLCNGLQTPTIGSFMTRLSEALTSTCSASMGLFQQLTRTSLIRLRGRFGSLPRPNKELGDQSSVG